MADRLDEQTSPRVQRLEALVALLRAQASSGSPFGFITPQQYGAKADGVTNDGPAIVAANAAAVAQKLPLWIAGGTFVVTGGLALTANVLMEGSGRLAPTGALSIGGPFYAAALSQLWSASTTVTFALGSVDEIWCNWWGAVGDGVTNNTAALVSAFAAFQTACQTPAGAGQDLSGPELRLGPGSYVVRQANLSSTAAILELKNIRGGRVRGVGTQQTAIVCQTANSPDAIVQRTNCQYLKFSDFDVIAGPFVSHPIATIAVGATTIQITTANLYLGQRITLVSFGNWYEEVTIASVVDGTHATINRPTRFQYATTDWWATPPRACVRDFSDVTDPGYSFVSTHNQCENMFLGSNGIGSCLYYYSSECNGGTGSSSDVNNDQHSFRNVSGANGVIGCVFIGHENAIQSLFDHCVLGGGQQFYGIHAPNGGNAIVSNGTALSGVWARVALGGINSNAFKILGAHSEGVTAPLLVANQWVPQTTYLTAGYTQPNAGNTVVVAVNSTANWCANNMLVAIGGGGYYTVSSFTATTITLLNLTYSENALAGTVIPASANIGQAYKTGVVEITSLDDVSGPGQTTVTVQANSGQPVVTVAATTVFRPGVVVGISKADGTLLTKGTVKAFDPVALTITLQANLTQTYPIGSVVTPLYYVDVAGAKNQVFFSTCQLDAGLSNIPGNEVHVGDAQFSSEISIFQSSLGVVGFTLENSFGSFYRAAFTSPINGSPNIPRETYVGTAYATVLDGHQSVTLSTGLQYPISSSKGLIPTVIRVSAANSPFTAVLDSTTIVDTSAGSVVINLPAIPLGHSCTVKQDESTALGANTLTVNAAANYVLGEPAPNNGSFVASFVITGDSSKGTQLTWRNMGSALITGNQPLLVE